MVNQYCAHSFARNWQLSFLSQRKGENDRRQYFMINLHERMLPTSAGVEPVTSWYPVGLRILLRNGIGKSIFYELCQYMGGGGGGACLYNKWLTSTLNSLPPKTCNCQSWSSGRSEWSLNLWGWNAGSWPSEINASAYVALLVFFFFFFFQDDARWSTNKSL